MSDLGQEELTRRMREAPCLRGSPYPDGSNKECFGVESRLKHPECAAAVATQWVEERTAEADAVDQLIVAALADECDSLRAELAALRQENEALRAKALPDGFVRYVNRVWRVDIAADFGGAAVIENTDGEHGVLCRMVPDECPACGESYSTGDCGGCWIVDDTANFEQFRQEAVWEQEAINRATGVSDLNPNDAETKP